MGAYAKSGAYTITLRATDADGKTGAYQQGVIVDGASNNKPPQVRIGVHASGAIQVPNISVWGVYITGPQASSIVQYYFVLFVVSLICSPARGVLAARGGERVEERYRQKCSGG